MIQAQVRTDANPFARSQSAFGRLCDLMQRPDAFPMTHTDLEQLLATDGRALLRQLFQDHLDLRGTHEQAAPHLSVVGDDGIDRPHRRDATRELHTLVGKVTVPRIGYSQRGHTSRFPMDAALNLARDPYSLGVRPIVALTVASSSFEESVAHLELTTKTHVAKRQVEKLARAAAVDFAAFYEQRDMPKAATESSLLVLTVDGKGIVVRQEDLRAATRKAAEERTAKLKTRLTKGEKKHAKRMATGTAVYSIEPHSRSAEDVISDLVHESTPEKRRRPKAEYKRVWASIEKDADPAIVELFDEAERRDPERRRRWVVLVDGNKDQLAFIQREANRRGVSVTVVLDFIHVLQYLWAASTAFHDETAAEREGWVLERMAEVLRGKAVGVAAGMRRSATLRDLDDTTRSPVDKCARYLLKYKRHLRYDEYLRDGLPIASGVIEGACRHLVKDRMDLSGAHWSLRGAEAVLQLRAIKASGDFAEYWTFREEQEYHRNHAERYQGDVTLPNRPNSPPKLRVVKGAFSSLSS
ncbi:MAG: ISKra4 family transposase [Myxococcales bacterium]|nr:ISKra4 family transposase [Myxococcales bacterium]